MNIGELTARMGLDWSDLKRGLNRAEDKIQNYQSQVSRSLGKARAKFQQHARSAKTELGKVEGPISTAQRRLGGLQSAVAGAGAAFAGQQFVSRMADFERSMSMVETISGATADQMKNLRAQAKKMGSTTEFSASQAADALRFLSMAGLDVKQSMGTLPRMLDLATAGQLDLARAADISTNVMSQFNMKVSELTNVNDALVAVQNSANTNIEEAANALTYAGAKASTFNMDIKDTMTLVGMLANNGIKASKAGTTLRQAMQRLLAPTGDAKETLRKYNIQVTDSEGNMRNFIEVVKDLADAGIGAQKMADLLGARAGNLTLIMKEGSEGIEKYNQKIRSMDGVAETAAGTIRSDMQGAIDKLQSRLESTAIAVWEEYKDTIKSATEDAAKYLSNHKREVINTVDAIVTKADELKNAVGPAIKGIAASLNTILNIYNSLPKEVTGPGASGLVGYILFGPYGAAAFAGLAIGNKIQRAIENAKKASVAEHMVKGMPGLNRQLADTNKELEWARNQLRKARMSQGENSAMATKWRQEVKELNREMDGYIRRSKKAKGEDVKSDLQRITEDGKSAINRYSVNTGKKSTELAEGYKKIVNGAEDFKTTMEEIVPTMSLNLQAKNDDVDATKKQTKAYKKTVASIRDQIKSIRLSEKEYMKWRAIKDADIAKDSEKAQKIRELIDLQQRLKQKKEMAERSKEGARNEDLDFGPEWKTMGIWEQMKAGSQDAFNKMKQDALNWKQSVSSIMGNAVNRMSGALAKFVTTGKMQWQDFAQSVMTQITKMMMRWLMFQAIKTGMSFMGGGGAGGLAAAGVTNATTGAPASGASGAKAGAAAGLEFARGGTIREPVIGRGQNTGRKYTIGENGPEDVIPKGAQREQGKEVKQVFNINAQTGPDGKIAQESMQQIQRKLGRSMNNAMMKG